MGSRTRKPPTPEDTSRLADELERRHSDRDTTDHGLTDSDSEAIKVHVALILDGVRQQQPAVAAALKAASDRDRAVADRQAAQSKLLVSLAGSNWAKAAYAIAVVILALTVIARVGGVQVDLNRLAEIAVYGWRGVPPPDGGALQHGAVSNDGGADDPHGDGRMLPAEHPQP